MYQLINEQKTIKFKISSLLVAFDSDYKCCFFIFYKSESNWYQIFCDENVVFINILDSEFDEVLSDLNQVKIFEFLFYDKDYFLLEYKNNKLSFIGDKYYVNFNIMGNKFFLREFKTI